MSGFFPAFIQDLPRPESAVRMEARIVPSDHALTMFYEVDEDVEVPEHRHGDQWGVVLAGSMDLEIDGVVSTYGAGDAYFVPSETPHRAYLRAGCTGIDVFADADRYVAETHGSAGR